MMKKVFVLIAALVFVSFAASAQNFAAGARLGAGIGFHGNGEDMDDLVDEIKSYGASVDDKVGANFIIAGYGDTTLPAVLRYRRN
ncbi:MAG: hypothetical protein LBQ67_01425 [Treponema sp.]|jgi:hypothetical protein|nr:hypothetical protein [Treponema sp.]